MTLYRHILGQAWSVSWKNKQLWFFGLFAALLGNSGVYEIIERGFSTDGGSSYFSWASLKASGILSGNLFAGLGKILRDDPVSLVIIMIVGLIVLALTGFLLWLTVISQVAIVNNSAVLISGKKNQQPMIQTGLQSGRKYFWPALILNVINRAIVWLALILLSFSVALTVARTNLAVSGVIYIAAFIIFAAFAIIFSFIIKYAIAELVIGQSGLIQSLRRGWNLFIDNWLVSVEMAFILFFVNVLVGLLTIFFILILAVPFLFLALVFNYLTSLFGFWLVAIVALITLMALIVTIGSVLTTFQIAAWTGLFLKLSRESATSKIVRLFSKGG